MAIAGGTRRRTALALGALLLLAGLTAVLLELGTFALVQLGTLPQIRPNRTPDPLWRGDHPVFGVWRHRNVDVVQASECFSVNYRTNALGMRDFTRAPRSPRRRVVVLGDSILDGWGLPLEERLSSRLEQETGVAHLNFAMPHFGPYQSFLVYEALAKRFSHEAVLIGVLPMNDFRDLDLRLASRLIRYEFLYRPYLVPGEGGESFVHRAHREPAWRRLLRRHSYFFNMLLFSLDRSGAYGTMTMTEEELAILGEDARRAPSWFYDYHERHAVLLEAVLERIADAAAGRPVVVVLLPDAVDLERFAVSGPDPLGPRLARFDPQRIHVVNLLPYMARHTSDWSRFFMECDWHWSAYANEVAARRVLERAGTELYGEERPVPARSLSPQS